MRICSVYSRKYTWARAQVEAHRASLGWLRLACQGKTNAANMNTSPTCEPWACLDLPVHNVSDLYSSSKGRANMCEEITLYGKIFELFTGKIFETIEQKIAEQFSGKWSNYLAENCWTDSGKLSNTDNKQGVPRAACQKLKFSVHTEHRWSVAWWKLTLMDQQPMDRVKQRAEPVFLSLERCLH